MGLLDDEEFLRSQMRATPRNQLLGLLSDVIAKGYSPERTQQMQGLSKFLGAQEVSQTLDRLSYGEPLTTGAGGIGGTTRVRPEALDAAMAAMNLAPLVGPTARVAGKAAAAGAKALGPTAAAMGENYMGRMGMMPGVVEKGGWPIDVPGRSGITATSKQEVKGLADSFADSVREMGFDATVDHSGSKAGASSYVRINDPQTGRFINKPIRISDHSKGTRELQGVIEILNPASDFEKVFSMLQDMRSQGPAASMVQNQLAEKLIAEGVKPKTAYQRASQGLTDEEKKRQLAGLLYP